MKLKIFSSFLSKSLRWKIMFSITVFFSIIGSSLFVTMLIDQYALGVIGRSFRSNEELNSFSNDIVLAENALETYINYRTYESINNYYIAANRVEYFCQTMQVFPSTNEIRHQEYIVHQLALSFLQYTSKAVAAHRANSPVNESYQKSLEVYQFLVDEISRLNILYMKKNSTVYNADRNNVRLILNFYIVFFAGFFMLLLLILYALVGSMTKPLGEISDVALRVAERDFDVPLFNRESHDEIGNICRAFDRMIISIREYIDTIWEKARTENELREREMEMQALYADAQLKAFQSQINPHFLFNTLNTGAQLAMMEGADKTCYFIEQTSDFFRYNIQQQKEDATISDELGMVDNFVYIMKVRFGQRLEFIKDVPQESFNQHLPSMTLQPLVENCIQHGLQNATGRVALKVERTDGFVEISISDNGSGFDPAVREKFLEAARRGVTPDYSEVKKEEKKSTEEHTGIGLINVFLRLRLYFHRDDVFDIRTNDDGQGTKFIIRIPENV
ncbi:sensor histidine kinase [Treponema sp.]|uniref:sensor histidine kinase n=1 Tax=Treponema sp. TaxID=166 RepID=UPI00389049B7